MNIFAKNSLKSLGIVLAAGALSAGLSISPKANAQEPFLAQITMFGGNFAPRGWAFCDGAILSINQNTALYSLLGTTFGGDGRTTFGLPDLRGRTAIHPGNGPGLSTYSWGQKGGLETVTLAENQMPSHTHAAQALSVHLASSGTANSNMPGTRYAATTSSSQIYSDAAPDRFMGEFSVVTTVTNSNTGGGQSHENRMPYQAIYHIIALQGVYPSRN